MNIAFTTEYPYLEINGFPVALENWSVYSDPTEAIARQDGFRVVFGSETSCRSRCDGFFYRSVEEAVDAARNKAAVWAEAGQPLEMEVIVKGFVFNV